ncbi:MAG: permease-like cell division protein FtsX [Alphaproteobacteria bacterium]|nr:permease-like cell division protein FtsX [Alphaproteobacteria bacterium]
MSNKNVALEKNRTVNFYAIIGNGLVLTLMTLICWLFINLISVKNNFKENINISIYLNTVDKDSIDMLIHEIKNKKYTQNVDYISKDEALKIWKKQYGSNWTSILDYNPLPESIDFSAKAKYINKDSLKSISNQLQLQYGKLISSIEYPSDFIESIQSKIAKLGIILLIFAAGLICIMVIIIVNTISLSIHGNRFLIKTMQLVGASDQKILVPFYKTAFKNALISSLVALVCFWGLLIGATGYFKQLSSFDNRIYDTALSIFVVLVAVIISLFSTRRTVLRYLKLEMHHLH